MTHRPLFKLLLALGIFIAGCGDSTPPPAPDASSSDVASDTATDVTSDVSSDVTSDASNDATSDAVSDAVSDASVDVSPTDVTTDAVSGDGASDATADVTTDSSATDAAFDSMTVDASIDVIALDVVTDAIVIDASRDAPTETSAPDVALDTFVLDAPTPDVAADLPAIDVALDAPVLDAPTSDASVDVAPVDAIAPDAAALCSSIPANTAPVIMDTYTTTPMPSLGSLTGGTILPGLYYETAHIYHGVASGTVHSWQATSVFDATATTATLNSNRDGAPFQQWAERLSVMGPGLTITIACPPILAGSSLTVGFNYTAGELHVFTYSDNTETVFTRQ